MMHLIADPSQPEASVCEANRTRDGVNNPSFLKSRHQPLGSPWILFFCATWTKASAEVWRASTLAA